MIRQSTNAVPPSDSSLLPPADAPLRLRFVGSQRHGQVVRIKSPKCTIGSAQEATFRLICEGVQPLHCLILRGPNGMVVRCLADETQLNDKKFDDAELGIGDRITVGPIKLEVLPFAGGPQTTEHRLSAEYLQQQAAFDETVRAFEAERCSWTEQQVAEQERIQKRQEQLDERAASLDGAIRQRELAEESQRTLESEVSSLQAQLQQLGLATTSSRDN